MSDGKEDRRRRFSDLPATQAIELDNLCDCFEQQLITHQSPSIETFLQPFSGSAADALLRELLLLEIEFQSSGGEPEMAGYLTRFPDAASILSEVRQVLCPDDDVPQTQPWVRGTAISIPNYSLLAELGTGGMGTVFRAVHLLLKNDAAVKVLKPGTETNEEVCRLFHEETSKLGQLRHPQIVQALYAGTTDDGRPYLVMELVKGLDVGQIVKRYGPLTVADACEIARQATLGIQHASECGMVHRDIKPSNLMLGWSHDETAEVKVADFGLARLRGKRTSQDEPIMGTLDYMAPEQYFEPSSVDSRADIFSLGCTLYACLIGQPPFAGVYQNVHEKMVRHRDFPPPPIRSLRPDVPEALEDVIFWAMAKKPAERFETALEFGQSLGHFSGGHDLSLLLETAEDCPEPQTRPLLIDSTTLCQK